MELFLLIIMYFLPSIVALCRRHKSWMAILLTNLLLGWTVLGWFVCIIWALTNNGRNTTNFNFTANNFNANPFDHKG